MSGGRAEPWGADVPVVVTIGESGSGWDSGGGKGGGNDRDGGGL